MKINKRKAKILLTVLALGLGLAAALYCGNDLFILLESPLPSESIGTAASGKLIHGKRLPSRGRNFRAYSNLGALIGRNTVNDRVRDAVVEAYRELGENLPDRVFVYGETSWPGGGRFRPHKTHQNGLAVDFFAPVLDARGGPEWFPASPFNTFGYGMEFDAHGKSGDLRIDFETMAAHLSALHQAAANHGLKIRIVIFAPDLQDDLFRSPTGAQIKSTLPFSTKPSWVRHDEHYHVDFELMTPKT